MPDPPFSSSSCSQNSACTYQEFRAILGRTKCLLFCLDDRHHVMSKLLTLLAKPPTLQASSGILSSQRNTKEKLISSGN